MLEAVVHKIEIIEFTVVYRNHTVVKVCRLSALKLGGLFSRILFEAASMQCSVIRSILFYNSVWAFNV